MQSNPWKTPLGLAFVVVILLAFVAGLFSPRSDPTLANMSLNESEDYSVDENALINANMEPAPIYNIVTPPAKPAPEPAKETPPPEPEQSANQSDTNSAADTDADPPAEQ